MNTFLILLLCSVGCCFAFPECFTREMAKCDRIDSTNVVSEADREKYCGSLKCSIGAYEKCGMTDRKNLRINWLGLKRAYSVACDESNPMRETYFQNLRCIAQAAAGDNVAKCMFVKETSDHREYCRQVRRSLDCLFNVVYRQCGQDARDAFAESYFDAETLGCH